MVVADAVGIQADAAVARGFVFTAIRPANLVAYSRTIESIFNYFFKGTNVRLSSSKQKVTTFSLYSLGMYYLSDFLQIVEFLIPHLSCYSKYTS